MANQKIMGALLARNAALSAGAPPAEASRAAIIGTVFPNPVMGAIIGRSLAKKGTDVKPAGGDAGGQLPAPPAPPAQPLAGPVDNLAGAVNALAGSVVKSAAALDALAKAGGAAQDPNKITAVERAGAGNPSQASQKKT